jgi:RHS repeat-associated protein
VSWCATCSWSCEEIPAGWGRTGIGGYGTDLGLRQKFTGKLRDSETTYDYFGARYFSGAQGRFTSVDPAVNMFNTAQDPQQWNRYPYTRNSPLKYVDPDGNILVLSGTASRQRQVERIANAGLFGVRLTIDQGGFAKLVETGMQGPPTEEQAFWAATLSTFIDYREPILVTLSTNSPTIVGSFAKSDIDVADLSALGSSVLGATGALAHELTEQYAKQILGMNFAKAHAAAIDAQSGVSGFQRIGETSHIDVNMSGRAMTLHRRDNRLVHVLLDLKKGNIRRVTITTHDLRTNEEEGLSLRDPLLDIFRP